MKTASRLCWLLLLTALALSHLRKDDLREVGSLLPELQEEPYQEQSTRSVFEFNYRGADYVVEPVAEYELYGLVVSHNNIHSFIDIYHTDDSVDIKDLCVIWGENAENTSFKQVEFWSEPWTCWTRWPGGQNIEFNMQALSNNHILSDNSTIRNRIRQMQIGDQVFLKGMLVNYHDKKQSAFVRKTSTVRNDSGNGACEVLFVEEAHVLKKGPQFWRTINRWSKKLLLLLLAWSIGQFLYSAYKPMWK